MFVGGSSFGSVCARSSFVRVNLKQWWRKTTSFFFWAKWIVSLENTDGSLCVDPAILWDYKILLGALDECFRVTSHGDRRYLWIERNLPPILFTHFLLRGGPVLPWLMSFSISQWIMASNVQNYIFPWSQGSNSKSQWTWFVHSIPYFDWSDLPRHWIYVSPHHDLFSFIVRRVLGCLRNKTRAESCAREWGRICDNM
jgi:hypothetical protein